MLEQEIQRLIEENETLKIENETLIDALSELEYELSELESKVDLFMFGEEESASSNRPVVRSANRDHFHRPECEYAAHIHEGIREEFSEREQAIAVGLKPCKTCKS